VRPTPEYGRNPFGKGRQKSRVLVWKPQNCCKRRSPQIFPLVRGNRVTMKRGGIQIRNKSASKKCRKKMSGKIHQLRAAGIKSSLLTRETSSFPGSEQGRLKSSAGAGKIEKGHSSPTRGGKEGGKRERCWSGWGENTPGFEV